MLTLTKSEQRAVQMMQSDEGATLGALMGELGTVEDVWHFLERLEADYFSNPKHLERPLPADCLGTPHLIQYDIDDWDGTYQESGTAWNGQPIVWDGGLTYNTEAQRLEYSGMEGPSGLGQPVTALLAIQSRICLYS